MIWENNGFVFAWMHLDDCIQFPFDFEKFFITQWWSKVKTDDFHLCDCIGDKVVWGVVFVKEFVDVLGCCVDVVSWETEMCG